MSRENNEEKIKNLITGINVMFSSYPVFSSKIDQAIKKIERLKRKSIPNIKLALTSVYGRDKESQINSLIEDYFNKYC